MSKKSRILTTANMIIFIVFVLIIFTTVLFFWFNNQNRNRIVNQNMEYVSDSTEQSMRYLEDKFNGVKIFIQSLSANYSNLLEIEELKEEKNFEKTLEEINTNTIFDRVVFVSENGTSYSLQGKADISDREYFREGMSGKTGMEWINKSRITGNASIIFYTPVKKGNSIIGVLVGHYEKAHIKNLLKTEVFGVEPDSLLTEANGDVIAYSGNASDYVGSKNFFEDTKNLKFTGDVQYQDIVEYSQSENLNKVQFSYDLDGVSVGSVVKLSNGWMLIQIYPSSVTQKMVNAVNNAGEVICILLVAVFLILFICFALMTMIQNKKMQMAVKTAVSNENIAYKNLNKSSANLADTVSILTKRYYKVLKLNITTDTFIEIKVNSKEKESSYYSSSSSQWINALAKAGDIHEDDIEKYLAFCNFSRISQALKQNNNESLSFEYRRLIDGEMRWVRMELMPSSEYTDDNQIIVLYVIDINDDIKSAQALKEAYEAAKRADAAKTNFLSSMSHDIRTPMNAIIGMTAIANVHINEPEKVADCLSKITVSGNHLLKIINEVLDMNKIESGKMDLNIEEFNLSELIYNLLAMSEQQIKSRNHKLSVSIQNVEHEKVIGDSQRIQQVFMNLMSNAVKYTPENGNIKLIITEKPTNHPQIGCYEFIFEDNGIGMSEEFVAKIFEPFERADNDYVEKMQGTGLGMPIARNIVRMMNGDIKVESEVDKGSKFTVTIYLELQDTNESFRCEEFVNLPILVADDDKVDCENTCEILSELGMCGEWVLNGKEAVDLAVSRHEQKKDFFAVILDWKMPEMDGITTTKEIKKRIGNDVPIIIISAYDWSDIESEARSAGVDAFISKPLFKSRMVHLFKELMGKEKVHDDKFNIMNLQNDNFNGKRVLLVEDNELNLEIVKEILSILGLEIEDAKNGKEAVEIMKQVDDNYFDIIFMDIQMPIMNGYEATMAIRDLPSDYAKKVPIIAMTANAFAEDVLAAKNAGMNEHIAKPINLDLVIKTLERWLN